MTFQEALSVLEITRTTTQAEATKAYKDLIRIWHPDNFAMKPDLLEKANSKTKQVNEAWEVFSRGETFQESPSSNNQASSARPAQKTTGEKAKGVMWKILGGLLVLIPIYYFQGRFDNPDQKIEKQLLQVANTTNSTLPMTLDSETVLTTTIPGPGRKFSYYYTVVNYTKAEVNVDYIKGLKPNLINGLKSAFLTDKTMKYFLDNSVVLDYVYKDKIGSVITTIEILPSEYK